MAVMVALGSNEMTSVPIYLKNGFSRQDALHQWFTLLDEKGYSLIYGSASKLELWHSVDFVSHVPASVTGDPEVLAKIWSDFSRQQMVFGLHRNAEFWRWRYLEHPRFNYRVMADDQLTTVAVSRIEQVQIEDEEISVLRILEFFSSFGDGDSQLKSHYCGGFLQTLLREASESGVSAADFRCSSLLMSPSLDLAGFQFREMERVSPEENGFAGQLNPTILEPRPINLHWKVRGQKVGKQPVSYFVKSDNDLDRPNIRGQRSARLPHG